jgi:HSP20 family protein
MFPMVRTRFPFAPLASTAFNRSDSLFDRFFGDDGEGLQPSWVPSRLPLAMWQDDDKFYVEAEIPGVTDQDVEIKVHNGVLTIKAERRPEDGRSYLYNGRLFGRFEQAVLLPEIVDSEKVEATLNRGVLHLTLPKHPAARTKKITLRSS